MTAFILPAYGMPCCGHRIVQHEPDDVSGSARCRCCATGRVPTSALVLMAEPVTASQTFTGVDDIPADRATAPSAPQGTDTGGPQ